MGRDPFAPLKLHGQMKEAGFVNISERRFPIPINPWPKGEDQKTIATMEMENLTNVADGITLPVFTRALDWTIEEVETLLVDAKRDLRDKKIHSYLTL